MSLKVLVCDTDQRFVERASQFLMSHGHQVVSESLSDDALDRAARWKPDVVVLSSELVDRQDDDFLSALQNLPRRPAILLTGQLDRFDAAWRAWRKGGDELLLKPVMHAWELHTAIITAIESVPRQVDARARAAASA